MKELNKDSGITENSVEAYLCASCSNCSCPSCTPCTGSYENSIRSGLKLGPAVHASENIREFY